MFRFRTGWRTVKLLSRSLLWLAVLVMSCSLAYMGGLIWINNSWAAFPDDDPATSFDYSPLLEVMTGEDDFSDLDADGDGQIPVTGGKLLKGNGVRDDNREKYFTLMPLGQFELWSVSANYNQTSQTPFLASVSKTRTESTLQPRLSGFTLRRLTVAYKDFWHLKVMSTGDSISNIFTSVFIHKNAAYILWVAFLLAIQKGELPSYEQIFFGNNRSYHSDQFSRRSGFCAKSA